MADSVTTSYSLVIDNIFVDGDTRAITLKNPKEEITSSEITALNAYMQTNNIIIGDKTGATFGKITKVTKRTVTKHALDI